jgi:outer membrane protein assembly factor BamD
MISLFRKMSLFWAPAAGFRHAVFCRGLRHAAFCRGLRRYAPPSILALLPILAPLLLALAACSGNKDEEIVPEEPVEQLYNDAMDKLMGDDYEKAAKNFDEVERQHPYSVWATKGQLMSAFAHYRASEYAEAVVTLDHFIELHPAHENIDYAYYLRALCYYERITDVARDQQMTERANDALEELVNRFPNSKFAADAKPKLVLVHDQLAGKEMVIGRYYQDTGHYLAAINRFSTVVTKYQTTSHVPEALMRLSELYTAMGVHDAAQEYSAVLGYNFPGSDWYKDSYDLVTDDGRKVPPAIPNPNAANADKGADKSADKNQPASADKAASPSNASAAAPLVPPGQAATPIPPAGSAPDATQANAPASSPGAASAIPPYSTEGITGIPYPGY